MTAEMEDILAILKRHWGYDSFRPGQREIIESVLSGHDTLGLMPTGGGKSITFQVPGLALGGLTLVVTPLVALMKDQVDNLRAHGIKAAFMHAGMPYGETSRVWQALLHGGCRFLYVSPERLQNERFREELRALKRVTLVVVDEAHCISQWGHDFRPPYLHISALRRILPPSVPFMAVTASATPQVARDICDVLEFRDARIFSSSFSRPNISYVVREVSDKLSQIVHILSRVSGTGIVYVRSRRRTLEIAGRLKDAGIAAEAFHAGMEYELKEERINAWKRGELRVMVATNAFGMGIDKPDVRVVIHYDMPPSMEEYYQEAGRAGRDGLPAYAVLLADRFDHARMRRRVTEAFPPREVIERNYELLCNFMSLSVGEGYGRLIEFDLEKFLSVFHLQDTQVRSTLSILGGAGYLQYIDEAENASRALILCTKEELYGLPPCGPHADGVLRALLRNCPGIFVEYAYFSEQRLAHDAGCTPQQVYDTLLTLSRMGVVSYVPRRRTPYIRVLTSREYPENIIIPRSVYQERMARMKERVESMIAYSSNTSKCRAGMILEYFGQPHAGPCGCCDTCRSARAPLSQARINELERHLLDYVRRRARHGASATEIIHEFGMHGEKAVSIAEYLADEGELTLHAGHYFLSD